MRRSCSTRSLRGRVGRRLRPRLGAPVGLVAVGSPAEQCRREALGDRPADVSDELHRLVFVVVEAERANHDLTTGVPSDYDAMAGCDPEAAIWVVMNRQDGHKVLVALNDPGDGEVRVEKSYSESSPTHRFSIDEPGFTAMYTVSYLRDSLLDG